RILKASNPVFMCEFVIYDLRFTFPLVNELVELTELNLGSNHLTQLPDLKRLPKLTVLNLAGNSLTTIKDAATRLPSTLESIDLRENQISDLTEVGFLKSLPQLKCFGLSGNSATVGDFNYRPFVASRLISVTTIDGNDLSDEELLLGQRFHLGKTFASFFPGCNRQSELVELLAKQSPPCSNPFSALTPTNPRLVNVKQDFVHNRSDLDSTSSMSDLELTPKRVTRSVPDVRRRANIRVVSPSRGNRHSSIIAPVLPRPYLKLPDLLSPEPDSRDSDTESARSTDTVVMTESISLQLDLETPTVEPLSFPPPTPTPEPRPEPFSPDLSCVQEVTEPESGLEVSSTPQRPQRTVPSSSEKPQASVNATSRIPTPTKTVLEQINEDSIIQKMTTQKLGWTNIVKESPFPSLISDDQDVAPPKVTPKTTATPAKVAPRTPASEATPTAPAAPETAEINLLVKGVADKISEILQQAIQTPNMEVLKRLESIEKMLKNPPTRDEAVETRHTSAPSTVTFPDMMRMFLPMPTKLQISPEPDDTTLVSWDTMSPVLPTVRGYAVYIDGKFHTEVKTNVIRFRCPINGRRIAIESISAMNDRSLRAEIVAGTNYSNKENVATTQKRILTPRSARI
uniref:Fibronectin type-III domain-containing protein n=1 Tax=Panagrellus redivivus TaxID=6233 RepID=A0A7E4VAG0_PANRE